MGNNQDICIMNEMFMKCMRTSSTEWYCSRPAYVAAFTTHPRTTKNTIKIMTRVYKRETTSIR
jgi:hypothetical protein